MKKVIFNKPLLVDGEEVKEIEFDINKVKGKNVFDILKSLIKSSYAVMSYDTDPVFLLNLVAEASGMAYEDLARVDLKTNTVLVDEARNYIIQGLSDVYCSEDYLKLTGPITAKIGEEAIEIKELNFNLDDLNGLDIQNTFKFLGRRGYAVSSAYEMDVIVGVVLMAKASNISFDDLLKLNLLDFLSAGSIVKNFFIEALSGFQTENN